MGKRTFIPVVAIDEFINGLQPFKSQGDDMILLCRQWPVLSNPGGIAQIIAHWAPRPYYQ